MAKSNGLSGAGPISRPRHVQVDPYSVPKNYADVDGVERFSTKLGEWQKIDKPKQDPSYKPKGLTKILENLNTFTRKYNNDMHASAAAGLSDLLERQLEHAKGDNDRVIKIFNGVRVTLCNALALDAQITDDHKEAAKEILYEFYGYLPTRHIAEEVLNQLGLEPPVEEEKKS